MYYIIIVTGYFYVIRRAFDDIRTMGLKVQLERYLRSKDKIVEKTFLFTDQTQGPANFPYFISFKIFVVSSQIFGSISIQYLKPETKTRIKCQKTANM